MSGDPIGAFSRYQTESLFVLVGRNPLPNYIAANLLLKPDGTLYLIYSEGRSPRGTGDVAKYLAAQLPHFRSQCVPVNTQNCGALIREIKRHLAQTTSGHIGLHYTGGTKMMAVHAYQAVEEFCKQNGRTAFFSYLDADTLNMTVEHPAGEQVLNRRVIEDVRPSLETLFALQGISLQGKLDTEPVHLDLVRALVSLYGSQDGIAAWKKGRALLQNSEGRLWCEVEADLQSNGLPAQVTTALAGAFGFDPAHTVNLQCAAGHAGMTTSRELALWLDGYWLENWVLACVQKLGIERRARSVEKQASRMFEIDVAFMRGYLLVALSCTASSDGRRAKQKFFEIYNRARNLGGDEARAGLVCAVEDPSGLEHDVAHEWYAGDRLRVFGREHLPNLDTHLKNWIERI
jgi:hypothetical protein